MIINILATFGALSLLVIAGTIVHGAICELRHQRAIERRARSLSSRRNGQHVIPASALTAGRREGR